MSQEPITCYCPTCGKPFRVPADLQGKKIVCKSCQTHFVVQAGKPGIPAPAPAAKAPAAAHATSAPAAAGGPTAAAVATKATATAAAPTAETPAPATAPAPPPTDDLAPIPFDDSPVPLAAEGATPAGPTIKVSTVEKVKIESKGLYFVVKLLTTGKMVHVNIENALNEHAADGWRLVQIVPVGEEAYAIMIRNRPPQNVSLPPAAEGH